MGKTGEAERQVKTGLCVTPRRSWLKRTMMVSDKTCDRSSKIEISATIKDG
jgi:hypothetical protein